MQWPRSRKSTSTLREIISPQCLNGQCKNDSKCDIKTYRHTFHWCSRLLGAIIKFRIRSCAPFCSTGDLFRKVSATIWTVFPNPISSARMPPRGLTLSRFTIHASPISWWRYNLLRSCGGPIRVLFGAQPKEHSSADVQRVKRILVLISGTKVEAYPDHGR